MEETHELNIAAEPEGLAVGPIVFQATTKVLVPIILAVMLIFPIVNLNVQRLTMDAASSSGSPILSNANAEAATKLNNYRILDREAGVYQIPVDRAIEILVDREQTRQDRVVSSDVPQ